MLIGFEFFLGEICMTMGFQKHVVNQKFLHHQRMEDSSYN